MNNEPATATFVEIPEDLDASHRRRERDNPVVYRAEDHEELSQRSAHARARLQRRTVTATGLAAIALAATPWDSPGPREPLPKPGPSKAKRSARKRQKAARKAARR